MRALILVCCAALAACTPATAPPSPVSDVPVVGAVCKEITIERFDIALKAYDAAIDAVNMLIDAKVITPGSPTAKKVADANDKVLAAFALAETARQGCNATSYAAAINAASAGIAELRSAIHGG